MLRHPDDYDTRVETVDEWTGAREAAKLVLGEDPWTARLMALWLEHHADQLALQAAGLEEIVDHPEADRLMEEAEAHRVSARAIRRKLLGESDG